MAKSKRKSKKASNANLARKRTGVLKRLERAMDKVGASTRHGGVSFRNARKQLGRGGRPRHGGLPAKLGGPVGTVLGAVGLKPNRSLKVLLKLVGNNAAKNTPEQLSDAVEAGVLTKKEAWTLDRYFRRVSSPRSNYAKVPAGMIRNKEAQARYKARKTPAGMLRNQEAQARFKAAKAAKSGTRDWAIAIQARGDADVGPYELGIVKAASKQEALKKAHAAFEKERRARHFDKGAKASDFDFLASDKVAAAYKASDLKQASKKKGALPPPLYASTTRAERKKLRAKREAGVRRWFVGVDAGLEDMDIVEIGFVVANGRAAALNKAAALLQNAKKQGRVARGVKASELFLEPASTVL